MRTLKTFEVGINKRLLNRARRHQLGGGQQDNFTYAQVGEWLLGELAKAGDLGVVVLRVTETSGASYYKEVQETSD